MSDWKFLNKHRICLEYNGGTPEIYWSTPEAGWNGMFVFWFNNTRLRCVCSDGMGWRHVSVSIIGDSRPPRWDVMCAVKDLFWDDEDVVVQFHPKKSEYVNYHPGCLHLWQPTEVAIPTPNPIMVGPK